MNRNALHCIALHCYSLHCTALQFTALKCTTLTWNEMNCSAQHYIILYCWSLQWTALQCSALQYREYLHSWSVTGAMNFRWTHLQFPLTLTTAFTVNKWQGGFKVLHGVSKLSVWSLTEISQNICILKSGQICSINSSKIGGLNK